MYFFYSYSYQFTQTQSLDSCLAPIVDSSIVYKRVPLPPPPVIVSLKSRCRTPSGHKLAMMQSPLSLVDSRETKTKYQSWKSPGRLPDPITRLRGEGYNRGINLAQDWRSTLRIKPCRQVPHLILHEDFECVWSTRRIKKINSCASTPATWSQCDYAQVSQVNGNSRLYLSVFISYLDFFYYYFFVFFLFFVSLSYHWSLPNVIRLAVNRSSISIGIYSWIGRHCIA